MYVYAAQINNELLFNKLKLLAKTKKIEQTQNIDSWYFATTSARICFYILTNLL